MTENWAMSGMSSGIQIQMGDAVTQIGVAGLLANVAVSFLGLGLFVLSPFLAAKIVD